MVEKKTYSEYCWKMRSGEEIIGATFDHFYSPEEAIEQIETIMGSHYLPLPKSLMVFSVYRDSVQRGKLEVAQDESIKFVNGVLSSLNCGLIMGRRGCNIRTKIGSDIGARCSYHAVKILNHKLSGDGTIYQLDDPAQKEEFLKEVQKRVDGRIKRQNQQKSVESRTMKIGSFENDTKKTIETATFAVYLNANQSIPEADVHTVGEIKFYKSGWRNVMYDLEQGKLFTRDGKKEIEAENTEIVLRALMERLANVE